MSAIKDGGPAFPIPGTASHQHDAGCGDFYTVKGRDPVGGMTLRDYFAAKAMPHLIGFCQYRDGSWDPENVALQAYELAYAMLAAREDQQ